LQVSACLRGTHAVLLADNSYGILLRCFLKDEVGQQSRGGIQVHDPVGIDNQRPMPVRVKPEVNPAFFILTFNAVME